MKRIVVLVLALALTALVFACKNSATPEKDYGTPVAEDFVIGKTNQTAGSVTDVTIHPKPGKSPGGINNIRYYNARYNDERRIPQTAGVYDITFDVMPILGWNAAKGLSGGTLTVTGGGYQGGGGNGEDDDDDDDDGNGNDDDDDSREWGEWEITIPATCTTEGEETRVEVDGTHSQTRTVAVDPDAHQWGEWEQTTDPTCTAEGILTRVCLHDSAHSQTRAVAIDPDAHQWDDEWELTADPSFIKEGIETMYCERDAAHTETRNVDSLPITTTAEWNNARSLLNGKTGDYMLNIADDIGVAGITTNSFGNSANLNVTLKGSGKLYHASTFGSVLRIGAQQTLIIDSADLALEGMYYRNNDNIRFGVVHIDTGGSLDLKNGDISSQSNDSLLAGVYVAKNATFTMSGGKISPFIGNTVHVMGTFTMNGGEISTGSVGVSVDYEGVVDFNPITQQGILTVTHRGTFTMNGGKIYNTNNNGIGVSNKYAIFTMNDGEISGLNVGVNSSYTFTMNGGKIYGNRGSGGLGVSGTFTMNGGEIYDNYAYRYGGGLRMMNGTFTMNGGKIYGNSANGEWVTDTVRLTGGGVCFLGPSIIRIVNGIIYGTTETDTSLRNSGVAFQLADDTVIVEYGTFNGDTWNSNGNLSSTNNTIRVENGVLIE